MNRIGTSEARVIPVDPHSTLNWEGIKPGRFDYATKKHFEQQDQMRDMQGNDLPILGRKHFEPAFGLPVKPKFCLKVYPDKHNRGTTQEDTASSVKKISYIPPQKRYGHRERQHLHSRESRHHDYNKTSTRTFSEANHASHREHFLEKEMGQKSAVGDLYDMRNGLAVTSLGDKAYKNPEYSGTFYKDGGLIAGSSIQERKAKPDSYTLPKHITFPLNPDRVTWKDKEKFEMIGEEKKAVRELDDWEQTTLKEANPKWRDPDQFDFEAPKKVDPKLDPKNQKKAAKK